MTEEYRLLKNQPLKVVDCHYCGVALEEEFDLGMPRGLVQSTWRRWLGLPYCAIICKYCRSIGGWEKPHG